MTIAITDEHRQLADVVAAFADDRLLNRRTRDQLDAAAAVLPDEWREIAAHGWLGLHVAERWGGQGFTLLESAIVAEQLAKVPFAGPLLPTLIASAVIDLCGTDDQRDRYLPGLADGTTVGAVGLKGEVLRDADTVAGPAGVVLGAPLATVLLVSVGADLIVLNPAADPVAVAPVDDVDPTRRCGRVVLNGPIELGGRLLPGARRVARRLGWVLAAAEAAGGARACLEAATGYAKNRVQFGRPIAGFQAVKHLCANMLADAEMATAAAWDAAQPATSDDEHELAAAAAAAVSLPAYVRAAERNIQVHGGIGYTWEHDAHIHLRRANALAGLFGPQRAAGLVAELSESGVRRDLAVELPAEAARHRGEARAFVERYEQLPQPARRAALVDSGYLVPHWPRPWGRDASAVEQLVIEEEFADRVPIDELGITGWVALTLAQHGSAEQVERWIRPTLLGEMRWCQMFSEPDAGSDAAAITTRGTRVDGGWLVSGQKVWTSDAHISQRGFATVRTNPEAAKHAGITMMAIDMTSPGVDVRPLRELTGGALFNEVFLDDVFVADDDVVGPVDGGWAIARATLGNERVTIGARRFDERSAQRLLPLAARYSTGEPDIRRAIGELIAEEQARRALGLRQAARAVAGSGPGPEGNVSKLLAAEHTQRTAGLGVRILADEGVARAGDDTVQLYFYSRCLTIAGGTSEIVRNQIAERLLGMPRDR